MTNTLNTQVPDVPMAMLTALPLTQSHWVQIARNASWQATRMNLNTFERHGVFTDAEAVDQIAAAKLRDPRRSPRPASSPTS